MPARNSDGTIRNPQAPKKLTSRTVRGRWVEAEVIARKRRGISFEAIAEQITQIGRGQLQPFVVLQGVEFLARLQDQFQRLRSGLQAGHGPVAGARRDADAAGGHHAL